MAVQRLAGWFLDSHYHNLHLPPQLLDSINSEPQPRSEGPSPAWRSVEKVRIGLPLRAAEGDARKNVTSTQLKCHFSPGTSPPAAKLHFHSAVVPPAATNSSSGAAAFSDPSAVVPSMFIVQQQPWAHGGAQWGGSSGLKGAHVTAACQGLCRLFIQGGRWRP